MREVVQVYFTSATGDQVAGVYNDGVTVPRPYPLIMTEQADTDIQAYLDSTATGSDLEPFDPYMGVTDEALLEEAKYTNYRGAESVIDAMLYLPDTATVYDEPTKAIENERRINRGHQNALTSMAASDEQIAIYIDSVWVVALDANVTVEGLDRDGLIAWDGSAITWPVWTPPAP